MADNFGSDLDQLPRSVINGQCSTSSGSTDFSFWLQADIQSPEIDFRFTPKSGHSVSTQHLAVIEEAKAGQGQKGSYR